MISTSSPATTRSRRFWNSVLCRPRRRTRRGVSGLAAEVSEPRVMLSTTGGLGSLGGQHGEPGGGDHSGGGGQQHGSGGQHHQQNGRGQNPGGGQKSGPHNNQGHNGGAHSGGGQNGGGGHNSSGQNGSNNNPAPAPSPQPASPQPASPSAAPATQTGGQSNPTNSPTDSPTIEPASSPASESTPQSPDTAESTDPESGTPQPSAPVVPTQGSVTPEAVDSNSGSGANRVEGADQGENGVPSAAAIVLPESDFGADGRSDTSSDHTFAVAASGGFISIESTKTSDPVRAKADSSPTESGSDTASESGNGAATKEALADLAASQPSATQHDRHVAVSDEGGFIELATTSPNSNACHHPVLDAEARQNRSSEADGSIGRFIAFDSADVEAWNAVTAIYSMSDDISQPDPLGSQAPQTASATGLVAAVFGGGAVLTTSHLTRKRWSGALSRLLRFAGNMLSRLP